MIKKVRTMKYRFIFIFLIITSLLSFSLKAQDASFYIKYADKGDADAMCKLADCYFRGDGGVKKDYTLALGWYVRASKKGLPYAHFMAAYCYFYKLGTTEDFLVNGLKYLDKALKKDYLPAFWLYAQHWKSINVISFYLEYLNKACQGGYPTAQAEYGIMYLNGSVQYNVAKDVPKAIDLLKKAAENDNLDAMYYLGLCHESGNGVPTDPYKAFEYYNKAVQGGYLEAYSKVGYAYLAGEGVETDFAKAYQYLRVAADYDVTEGYAYLGDIYYYGLGIDVNYKSAKEMYETAAAKGNPHSMCQLALIHGYGLGVDEDKSLMHKYYKQASDLSFPAGIVGLGNCHMNGYGVADNPYIAFHLYKRAAMQEYAHAYYLLSLCYREGKGIAKNTAEYITNLEKAARLGYTSAKSTLGFEYLTGEFISGGANVYIAERWFKQAAEEGDVYSEGFLGYSYYTGTELAKEKNYPLAYEYLTRALRNLDFDDLSDDLKATVYRSLAGCYRYGRGCEADQSLATFYTEKAAQYGDEGSKRAAQSLRKDPDTMLR